MNPELTEIFADSWTHLVEAGGSPRSQWRICSLATVCSNGFPRVRQVVLREADCEAGELKLFTDPRSPKWQELRERPKAEILFWSVERKVQLRCSGSVRLHQDDTLSQSHQERLPENSAGDYAAQKPPGDTLGTSAEGQQLGQEWHFGVIVLRVERMDWLQLSPEGHRRASFEKGDQDWEMNWLQP